MGHLFSAILFFIMHSVRAGMTIPRGKKQKKKFPASSRFAGELHED